ncbi:MAG: 3-deoxy-7-phosphoheptulonate synthase, partial [Gammaproteobacteria bacterium]|nr:3-deoxy-7-phosphoheptulonate synthase [Gammaproteobacteria bacterium]
PATALVDGPQALTLDELAHYVEDIHLAREAYLKRKRLAGQQQAAQPAKSAGKI